MCPYIPRSFRFTHSFLWLTIIARKDRESDAEDYDDLNADSNVDFSPSRICDENQLDAPVEAHSYGCFGGNNERLVNCCGLFPLPCPPPHKLTSEIKPNGPWDPLS